MKIRNGFLLGLAGGLGVLLAIAIGASIQQISTVLVWAFAGIFLALGVEPLIQILIKRRVPRWGAVLLVFVLILGIAVGAVWLIIPTIVAQFTQLIQSIVSEIEGGALEGFFDWVRETFPQFDVDMALEQLTSALTDFNTWSSLPPWVAEVAGAIVNGVGQLAFTLGGVFIVVVLMLYFTGSLPSLKSGMYRLVPASSRPKFIEIAEQVMQSVGRFVLGQGFLGLCNGVLSFIMLSIVGSELAVVYAFVALIASTIPLIGTISASVVISLLVLLLDGPQTALPVAIYYLIYMQVEAYVISPQIMNRAVKVPGVVVVLSALIGGTLLGILGALVAIPVAAAIQLILKEVVIPRQDAK
ncbi:Predicted PurR-regulated permease PerM [Agrococcus baldri]|uniref:Predicted PurR-regulated permease PerM n=1 Tax=Agrococcus baldri TaxID=153730 RepID=A0AA94HNN0_9MICO|nr:AI-2E family transporter [Agrococcus baldri]SFS16062.1 Predicted PurR-regulated permease PerM [Agrococcus baldri]